MEFHFGSVLVTKGQADMMSVVAHEPVIKCKHEIKYVTSWRRILFVNFTILMIHKLFQFTVGSMIHFNCILF